MTPELAHAALAQLAEGVIVADAGGRIAFVNEAATLMHGVSHLGVAPEAYAETYHLLTEDGRPYPSEDLPLARAVRGTAVRDERWRIRRPDGSEILALGSACPVRDASGRQVGAVLTLRDHTAREAAEAAERRARFLADFGTALQPLTDPDALMATAAQLLGSHLGADRCAYAEVEADQDHFSITGNYTRGDTSSIVGRFSFSAFGAEVLRLMHANVAYVVEDVAADPQVTAADRAAYEQTQIAAVICVPLHKAGRFVAAMAVHQRATRRWTPEEIELVTTVVQRCWESLERARALRSLRARELELTDRTAAAEEARREAAEANMAKSAFLATMSHELRTPINAIMGYAQLIEFGIAGPLTPDQRTYLERLTASSQHLLGIVSEILDLSRIEAGVFRIAPADATTGTAVQAAVDLALPIADARGVRVTVQQEGTGAPYVGDEDRVRQVVLNLLSNAVKFTPVGGTVTISCATVDQAPPGTQLHGSGPWSYVQVCDTGVGIPPEEHGRIFTPFHQVDSGHTRRQGGTGLGLTISRRLARLMGGDITVASVAGEGSTFTLWLPAAGRAAGAAEQLETALERATRATVEDGRADAPEMAAAGSHLRRAIDDIVQAFTDRLRADPLTPRAGAMRTPELEDHLTSMLGDLAQSLLIVGSAGADADPLLTDSSVIQRTIAEFHGARRYAQGWSAEAVQREYQLLREETARALRGRPRGGGAATGEALRALTGLIDRAEAISLRAWQRAAAGRG
ncbi:MAG: GAF domain-containing protein [Gemmatimonadaceae bacterium]|nr:GAF domain-containing protein [Gemmatimonadaceae bacterium]